jgi:hypothetical protein
VEELGEERGGRGRSYTVRRDEHQRRDEDETRPNTYLHALIVAKIAQSAGACFCQLKRTPWLAEKGPPWSGRQSPASPPSQAEARR